jgi:hypothetical protein
MTVRGAPSSTAASLRPHCCLNRGHSVRRGSIIHSASRTHARVLRACEKVATELATAIQIWRRNVWDRVDAEVLEQGLERCVVDEVNVGHA